MNSDVQILFLGCAIMAALCVVQVYSLEKIRREGETLRETTNKLTRQLNEALRNFKGGENEFQTLEALRHDSPPQWNMKLEQLLISANRELHKYAMGLLGKHDLKQLDISSEAIYGITTVIKAIEAPDDMEEDINLAICAFTNCGMYVPTSIENTGWTASDERERCKWIRKGSNG